MGYFEGTQSEMELRSQFGIGNWARELVQITDKEMLFDWLAQNGATRFEAFGVYDFWAKEGMGDARQFKWLFEYMLSRPLTEVRDKYRPYLTDGELNDIKCWAVAQRVKPIGFKVAFIDCLRQLELTATDIEDLGEVLQRRGKSPQFDDDHRKWLKDYYNALNLAGGKGVGTYMDGAKELGEAHGKAAFRECLSRLLPLPNPNKDDGNDVEILRLLANIDGVKQKWFEEYVEERKPRRQTAKSNESGEGMLPTALDTVEAKELFSKIEYCVADGRLYQWKGSASLFGYFIMLTSLELFIRGFYERLPLSDYKRTFQCTDKFMHRASQFVSDFKKDQTRPKGYAKVEIACPTATKDYKKEYKF